MIWKVMKYADVKGREALNVIDMYLVLCIKVGSRDKVGVRVRLDRVCYSLPCKAMNAMNA